MAGCARWAKLLAVGAALAAAWVATREPARGEPIHRNGFAGRKPAWARDASTVRFEELIHELTEEQAHRPPTAERIQINAQPPYHTEREPTVLYSYPTPRARVADGLSVGLWVRASRAGVQLRARVVLPKERNPDRPDEPLTAVLVGPQSTLVNRWEPLKLSQPVKLLRAEQQLMRARFGRDVDFTDAYVDRLILNLYTQPGPLDVYIDDLEIGPVEEDRPQAPAPGEIKLGSPASRTGDPPLPGGDSPRSERGLLVELTREKLLVGGKPFFFRAISPGDTPLKTLREAGFNALVVDPNGSADLIDDAVNRQGFWLIPELGPALDGAPQVAGREAPGTLTAGPAAGDLVSRTVGRFAATDAVLLWELGQQRRVENIDAVARGADAVRRLDPQRPIGADVTDGLWSHSRNLDLVGVHRYPVMTSLELNKYVQHLTLRKNLARPGTFFYTAVQTHLPDWQAQLAYDKLPGPGFAEPTGPLPEQIRLLTYAGLSAGARGLVFSADRFRADSHNGRDRLLALALLNQELHLLEPILLSLNAEPDWIDTSHPQVKAAVLRSERGVLVVPMWIGGGAQYVPGQSAVPELTLTAPMVPPSSEAWLVSPGEVRVLRPNRSVQMPLGETRVLQSNRVVGGTRITIPEFGLTAAVVFTSDIGLVSYWQKQSRNMGRTAAEWSLQLARIELEKTQRVQEQLAGLAPPLPDAEQLVGEARRRLTDAERHLTANDYRSAYQEAQRCLRPVRILMRAQWEQAVQPMDSPAASPYALSFYTLPRHWQLRREILGSAPGTDLLGDGDFEAAAGAAPVRTVANGLPVLPGQPGWAVQQVAVDDVELDARVVADQPPLPRPEPRKRDPREAPRRELPDKPESKQVLRLMIAPKKTPLVGGKPPLPPLALDRTVLAVHSPVARFAPGTLVRVSAWVRIDDPIKATADGALFFDTAGGEPLAVRLTEATATQRPDKSVNKWRRYFLYRRVPASGQIQVTLALTGLGTVYFDDVRIEPLTPGTATIADGR